MKPVTVSFEITDCRQCPASSNYDSRYTCMGTKQVEPPRIYPTKGIPAWCPLRRKAINTSANAVYGVWMAQRWRNAF